MAAKRTKRTPKKRTAPDWGPKFLAALRDTANIRKACDASKVGRTTVYERRDADASFAAAMAAAIEEAVDSLELEARRRAHKGCARPVFHQGVKCGEVREYSDTLMIFLLKAHRPEKYRDNVRHEHSGPNGGAIPAKVTHDIAADLEPYADAFAAFARSVGGRGEGVPPDGPREPVPPA